MVERPNHPTLSGDNVRKLQCRRHIVAKRQREHPLREQYKIRRSDDSSAARKTVPNLEACMLHVKPIGKPYAGNPHVRFDRGPQETELKRHRA